MTRKTFGIFATAIICAAMVSISISSCDSSNTPTTPGSKGGVDQSKAPEVLGGQETRLIGFTLTGVGGVSVTPDANGNLVVSGMNGQSGNGLIASFDSPVSIVQQSIDASISTQGGALAFEMKDASGITEARVDIKQEGSGAVTFPTFNSHPGGGTPQYDVYIANNGVPVAQQLAVPASQMVRIFYPASCVLKLVSANWSVVQVSSQCVWKYGLNPCCDYQFQLPDGRIIPGNEIKFVERNSNGVYVYLQTKSIFTSGNVASYIIKGIMAYSATAQ